MTANQTINFKDPSLIATWLDTALSKEKEKYEKCPVMQDLVPDHQNAQGWGYALVGYFLLEQSFKALLYVRGKNVPKTTLAVCPVQLVWPGRQDRHPGILRRLPGNHWREKKRVSVQISRRLPCEP